MKIPDGYETVKARSKRLNQPETTIRYWLRKGKLPYKTVKLSIRVIPVDAQPLDAGVKA